MTDYDKYLDHIIQLEDDLLEESLQLWEWIEDSKTTRQVYEDMELQEDAIVLLELIEHRAGDAIINTIVEKMICSLSLNDLDLLGIAPRGQIMDKYRDEYLQEISE